MKSEKLTVYMIKKPTFRFMVSLFFFVLEIISNLEFRLFRSDPRNDFLGSVKIISLATLKLFFECVYFF